MLTPKGHVLSFVLPKILEEHKSFHKFYAMEELGESIHAALNDIERKIWFVFIQGFFHWDWPKSSKWDLTRGLWYFQFFSFFLYKFPLDFYSCDYNSKTKNRDLFWIWHLELLGGPSEKQNS